MITEKEIFSKFPDRTILQILDYDDNFYVVEAPLKNADSPYDALWALDKKSGKLLPFNAGANIDKFIDACQNKQIFSRSNKEF